MNSSFIPNLFVLGAAKCGTTTIHEILSSHPEICMSFPKEPFFFECEFHKGLDFYREKYFSHYSGESYAGESRHRNLYLPYIPSRIYQTSPGVKLIVILRNPAERALSHWWQYYSRKIDRLSFDDAIKVDMTRINAGGKIGDAASIAEYCSIEDNVLFHRTYVDSGYYLEQITRYTALFGKENLLVLFTEDLDKSFEKTTEKIFNHLGLKSTKPEETLRKNPRKLKEANDTIHKLARITGLHAVLGLKTKEKLLRWSQSETLLKWRYRKTLAFLKAHYKSHNESLSAWLEKDLSFWND